MHQRVLIASMGVPGRCCNRCTRLDSITGVISHPCSIESSAVVPSRFSNHVAVVLVIESLVQFAIEISPLHGCQAYISV